MDSETLSKLMGNIKIPTKYDDADSDDDSIDDARNQKWITSDDDDDESDEEDKAKYTSEPIINIDDEDYEEKLKAYLDVPFTSPVNNGLKKKIEVAKSKSKTQTGSIKGLTTSIFHSLVTDKVKPKSQPKSKSTKDNACLI